MRIAIIYSEKKDNWVSCISIKANLLAAYKKVSDHEFQYFNFNNKLLETEIYSLSREIKDFKPQKIIFLTSSPQPYRLIASLDLIYGLGTQRPEIYVHILGDFTLDISIWYGINHHMKKFPFKIICASSRQKELLKSLLVDDKSLFICPFPTNEEIFNYQNIKKTTLVPNLPNTKNFLYTGRISDKKNIEALISLFKNEFRNEANLILAGSFDDIGLTFNYVNQVQGYQYNKLKDELETASNIVFLGKKSQTQLAELYNFADYYISLSTYHDEDFGMSCSEALLCGTPLCVTDWGGYADFLSTDHSKKIDVNLTSNGAFVVRNSAITSIQLSLSEQVNKQQIADQSIKKLSIAAVSDILKNLIEVKSTKFAGFNDLMKGLSERELENNTAFFDKATNKLCDDYIKVYKNYVS